MASKDERLLEALRSLTPPKGGAGGPPRPPAEPPRTGAEELPDDEPPSARRRAIALSVEEAGLFFLAALLLVVLAFLLGWYGRGLAPPGRTRQARRPEGEGGTGPLDTRQRLSIDASSARDLGARDSGATRSGPPKGVYTLLAARFPRGELAEAEDHRAFLERQGYGPAFLRKTKEAVELCVHRFHSQRDPQLLRWRSEISELRDVYARCRIVRIPCRYAPGSAESGTRRGEK